MLFPHTCAEKAVFHTTGREVFPEATPKGTLTLKSSLQNCEKIDFNCANPLICGVLLWQIHTGGNHTTENIPNAICREDVGCITFIKKEYAPGKNGTFRDQKYVQKFKSYFQTTISMDELEYNIEKISQGKEQKDKERKHSE